MNELIRSDINRMIDTAMENRSGAVDVYHNAVQHQRNVLIGTLMGEVMKISRGHVNPAIVSMLLKERDYNERKSN